MSCPRPALKGVDAFSRSSAHALTICLIFKLADFVRADIIHTLLVNKRLDPIEVRTYAHPCNPSEQMKLRLVRICLTFNDKLAGDTFAIIPPVPRLFYNTRP